mmetsp:Transcript_11256/g.12887  ORF Transcript_11256/g.12887 Transcript_11256/m.12887 type:complete len:162 (-) Transcript_11256:325-810(-)
MPIMIGSMAMLFAIIATVVLGFQQQTQQPSPVVGRRAALTTILTTTISQLLLPSGSASAASTTSCIICGTYEDSASSLRYVISLQPGSMFFGNNIANIVVKGSNRGRTVLPALIKSERILVDMTLLDGPDELKGVFDSKEGESGVIQFAKGNRRWIKVTQN